MFSIFKRFFKAGCLFCLVSCAFAATPPALSHPKAPQARPPRPASASPAPARIDVSHRTAAAEAAIQELCQSAFASHEQASPWSLPQKLQFIDALSRAHSRIYTKRPARQAFQDRLRDLTLSQEKNPKEILWDMFNEGLLAPEEPNPLFAALLHPAPPAPASAAAPDADKAVKPGAQPQGPALPRAERLIAGGGSMIYEGALLGQPPFFFAALLGDIGAARAFLSADEGLIHIVNESQEGVMAYALVPHIAVFLLKNGADPNHKDKKGFAPLSHLYDIETAKAHIAYGAHPNAKNRSGQTLIKHHETFYKDKDRGAFAREMAGFLTQILKKEAEMARRPQRGRPERDAAKRRRAWRQKQEKANGQIEANQKQSMARRALNAAKRQRRREKAAVERAAFAQQRRQEKAAEAERAAREKEQKRAERIEEIQADLARIAKNRRIVEGRLGTAQKALAGQAPWAVKLIYHIVPFEVRQRVAVSIRDKLRESLHRIMKEEAFLNKELNSLLERGKTES